MSTELSSQFLLATPLGKLVVPDLAHKSQRLDSVYFSLIIPTYNEGKNIERIVQLLSRILDHLLPNDYELIVVDDDSPDRTWQLAHQLTSEYPQLRVMRRQTERGLSTAVIRGWQSAKGEILGVIDGDLQHPPEVLSKLLAAMQQGADLAVASRHVEGGGVSDWGLIRRCLSRGAQFLGLLILPTVVGRVSDPMSGYFMVRRSAIQNCLLNPLGYKILLEVIGRGQIAQVAEVGYIFQERLQGESKVTWKQYVEYLLHLTKLRSRGRLGKLRQTIQFPLGKFVQFGLVGLSGVFVDLSVFYLLRSQLGLGIARSTIFSAEVAVVNNFIWNDSWTFRNISCQQTKGRQRVKRFFKFNIICLAGIILQALLASLLHDWLHWNEFIAKLTAIAITMLWNFWLSLKLSWRVTDTK